jgi:hypothetical protein
MMSTSELAPASKVLLDYISPEGPRVLGVKAVLAQRRTQALRDAGYYDDYVAKLAPSAHEAIAQSIASSWLPSDLIDAQFAAIDALSISEGQLARMAEPIGVQLFKTLFAAFTSMARAAGEHGLILRVIQHTDRVWTRLYRGGGVKITQTSPKDVTFELIGLSFASSRAFRVQHCAFMRGLALSYAKACSVREVPSTDPRSQRLVIALTWV